jgi:hypothetical protein
MPVVAVAYWFIYPPKNKIVYKDALSWLIFPALYLVYTLIRGASINWYPYPFLNPGHVGGYVGVAAYSLGILVVFIGFSAALVWATNKAHKN